MFNMFSPIQFNLDGGPGRDLLFRSNYDLRTSVNSYNGISFAENAEIRSEFQRLIGMQNLEAKLDAMAKDPSIIHSMNEMKLADRSADPSKFPHNIRIKNMFDAAKKKAWATLRQREDVKVLIQKDRDTKAEEARRATRINKENRATTLANIPN